VLPEVTLRVHLLKTFGGDVERIMLSRGRMSPRLTVSGQNTVAATVGNEMPIAVLCAGYQTVVAYWGTQLLWLHPKSL
jgi:anthranilate/para-aminobenzoate synthase component II